MSDEMKVLFRARFALGNSKWNQLISGLKLDQTTAIRSEGVQAIGIAASGEAIAMCDVTSAGLALFINLDADNNIQIGKDSSGFVDFLELEPGEFSFGRLSTNAPYAKALTAESNLYYCIFQTNP